MYELMLQVRDYLSGMWKYRWWGILASWLVCIGGWAYIYTLPDMYQANTVIQVDTESVLTPLLKGLAVETDPSKTVALVTRKLLSRPNLERVIQESDLGLKVSNQLELENLVQKLQRLIEIKSPGAKSRRDNTDQVITISFKNPKPKTAWIVVDKLVNSLVEDTLGANRSDTTSAQKFLNDQIREYEKRLVEAEQRLAEFKKQNVGLMPGESGGYYSRLQKELDSLQDIETDLQLAQKKRDVLKAQLQSEIPLSLTRSYDKKIQEHEDKLNSLLLQYTSEHPDVQAEKNVIENLKKNKLQALESSSIDGGVSIANDDKLALNPVYQSVNVALKDAEVAVSNLTAQREEQKNKIKRLRKLVDTVPEVEAKLARLNRDYEVTKTQHAALLTRLESARLSSEAGQSSEDIKFKVIEPPIVPIKPIAPNRLLLNLAVLVLGIGAFFGITYLILQLKPVFLTKNALAVATGLPILGSVSMILDKEAKKHKRNERIVIAFLMLLLLASLAIVVAIQAR